jgi:hypothetical protein
MGGIDWTGTCLTLSPHAQLSPAVANDYLQYIVFGDLSLPQRLVEFRISPQERPRTKAGAIL